MPYLINIPTYLFFSLSLWLSSLQQAQSEVEVDYGSITHIENFPSQYVSPHNIDIWLPADFDSDSGFGVLYMMDGQMLFDSSQTWNGQAWEAEVAATWMMETHTTSNFIIVGVWNAGADRHREYFPQKVWESLSPAEQKAKSQELEKLGRTDSPFTPYSDDFLKFLVYELRPFINNTFEVDREMTRTGIMGSSMGGLISLYAFCQYPDIFGRAACMSTHWPGTFSLEDNPILDAMLTYLDQNIPDTINRRIYFDHGDQTLDSMYVDIQPRVDSLFYSKGWDRDHIMSKFFRGKNHSEKAWRDRLLFPFGFLF